MGHVDEELLGRPGGDEPTRSVSSILPSFHIILSLPTIGDVAWNLLPVGWSRGSVSEDG